MPPAPIASIPSELRFDIAALNMGDAIRIGEYAFPEGVRPAGSPNEVIVHVVEPKLTVEEPAAWGRLGAADDAKPVPTLPGAYQDYYRAVAGALTDGAAPPVPLAESIAVLEVLDAARQSAREETVVRLPPQPH